MRSGRDTRRLAQTQGTGGGFTVVEGEAFHKYTAKDDDQCSNETR